MRQNRFGAHLGLLTLAAAAGTPAHAGEEPSVTWLWEVTTDDGDALVEPGETATVTLSADMEPSVGEPGQTDGFIVVGIGSTIFDTIGGMNADRGGIADWQVLNMLDFQLGDLTTSDGVSLFGTLAGQGPSFNLFFTDDDPVDVLTWSWSTDDFSGYVVQYETSTEGFLIGEGDEPGDIDDSFLARTVFEAKVEFHVIPSPTAASAILFLSPVLLRRHRARRPCA